MQRPPAVAFRDELLEVEEEARLKDQQRLLESKDETVQSSLTVRRAVSLLAEIGTPEATGKP